VRDCLKTAGLVALILSGFCQPMPAQTSRKQDAQSGTRPGGTVRHPLQIAVSGCLKRVSNGEGYSIADDAGRTWKLVGDGVNFAEHVNQRVMITGKPDTSTQQQEKVAEGDSPQLGVRVLTIKTVSPSCGQ